MGQAHNISDKDRMDSQRPHLRPYCIWYIRCVPPGNHAPLICWKYKKACVCRQGITLWFAFVGESDGRGEIDKEDKHAYVCMYCSMLV